MATTSVTVIQINGIPTSPLEGKFDFTTGRFLTDTEDGDRMDVDGEEQVVKTVGTVIDDLFKSAPPTPVGPSTPGVSTPIHSRFNFPGDLHKELEKYKGQEDAFYSGLSEYHNFGDTDRMDIDSDASSIYDGSTNGSSVAAVSTVPSSPGNFLRVETDLVMFDSDSFPDSPITDVSGFDKVVSLNGSSFSSQDAYHLCNLLHAARDLTNETVAKFLHAVFEQDQWSQWEISNSTTPYLYLANLEASREGGSQDLANGLRAFHRLAMAKPTPKAMAKAIRQVRHCPSAADVDQVSSVDWADMPLTDIRSTLYGLLMESSGTDYSNAPLSPSLEGGMSLISGNVESSEYQYPEGCFFSENDFLRKLGRGNLTREDGPTAILAWLMLAQLTFSTKSWTAEFSKLLSQSPAYVEARASVLAEMYQVSKDMVSQDLVLQSIDFKVFWANWVGNETPAPWMSNETN